MTTPTHLTTTQPHDAFNALPMVKPYALMDLDDTLFQTMRKMDAWQMLKAVPTPSLTLAAVNKRGEPLSFFTPKQAQFYHWLSQTTELIPVTARDRQEIRRVQLPFASWQVLTHGAVILQPDGIPLPAWQQHMATKLQDCQSVLSDMLRYLQQIDTDQQLRITPHDDQFGSQSLTVYLAVKHQAKNAEALLDLGKNLVENFTNFSRYFYLHVNANNLAILPHGVHKRHAVLFLQQQHFDPARACFGFGDSLADVPFLQCLDWYGTPCRGQLHAAITSMLNVESPLGGDTLMKVNSND